MSPEGLAEALRRLTAAAATRPQPEPTAKKPTPAETGIIAQPPFDRHLEAPHAPPPTEPTTGTPEWWSDLTEAGRAPLIAKASSTLSPRTAWHNLNDDNKKKVTAAYEAQQKAIADAPTWAEVMSAAPKNEKGRPDTDLIFSTVETITGGERVFGRLTPEQKIELLAAMKATAKELAVPPRKAGYGEQNKLVSKERAEELRVRLRAKLKNQVSAGIDPEILAIGTELAAFHIEAGARKFADFARAIAKDLGVAINDIRPYLRSWYNGARDLMEDAGHDIAGMETPDQVREALKTISAEDQADETAKLEKPSPAPLEGAPTPKVQGIERGGQIGAGAGLRGGTDTQGDQQPGS